MKLLFIDFTLPYVLHNAEYPAGGWATELQNWIEGLTAHGHRSGVLTWKGAKDYVGAGSPCDLIDTYDPAKGLPVFKYFYSYIPSLLSAARRYQPDIVIQSVAGVHTGIMAFVARRLGVPFVHRVANDVDADGRCAARLRRYENTAYRYGLDRAELIVCQNTYQAEALERTHGATPRPVVHNPFKAPGTLPPMVPRGGRDYVAWMGVFKAQKNLPLLLRIAKALPNVHFRVAGGPPPDMEAEAQRTLEALRGLSNVELVGYVRRTDVLDFLARAVCLLCTSHFEGFSNVFLEALTAGTPVLTRKTVDPDHIIERNALGGAALNEEELQAAVANLWRLDGNAFDAMAIRCREYVVAHHAPAAKAAELVRLLDPFVARA
ncbi:MAG TPA: glycosyltransferase family 4 protein [Rhizomicrobium sp.]|jgi:glycosyltransferase involved in cell wall biosynthesis